MFYNKDMWLRQNNSYVQESTLIVLNEEKYLKVNVASSETEQVHEIIHK